LPIDAKTYDTRTALAELRVVEVFPMAATVELIQTRQALPPLPSDVVAMPLKKRAAKHAVELIASVPARTALETKIAASPTLRLARNGEDGVLATLRLVGNSLTIEDEIGALFPAFSYSKGEDIALKNLANLGVARAVRALDGEYGVSNEELDI